MTEYDRGLKEGKKHANQTTENWLRPTLGPLIWLGVPLFVTWRYIRTAGLFPKAASDATKGASNPISAMMEMMMPIHKRQFRVDVKGTSFRDVIGVEEAKSEIAQYVDFLRTPTKFTRLGARLPRGCLLTGEPGTGKTLLAKAVAGEADVPFFSCSGADFIEIMGGSGPKRVRELFQEARESAPSVIFIDELDAIGSRGGKTTGSVSSEENRTINQLLAELDGLSGGSDAVVVLAATNFQDNIDKALLRDGRFDRKVNIDMPDLTARRELFKFYLDKVITGDPKGKLQVEGCEAVTPDNSISNEELANQLADLTAGVSPATIATVVNEAALQCASNDKKLVDIFSLRESIDNTLMGKQQRRNRMSDEASRRIAVHESGHALVSWMLPQQKDVLKVSVLPRGHAMGYTQRAGTEYHEYTTNVTLFSDITVLMGGRAAEDVVVKTASVGAVDDMQRATEITMQKLLSFGMSPNTGLLSFHPEEVKAGRSFVHFSEHSQASVEREAKRIVESAFSQAKELVEQHREKLDKLVDFLLEKKEAVKEDIERVLGPRPSGSLAPDITKTLNHGLAA